MKIFYLFLISGTVLKAQEKPLFNRDLLEHLIIPSHEKDSIFPMYRNGAFEYVNIITGKVLFNKKFREAYPFAGKSALVFDSETHSYNAIDRNGSYLLQQKNIYEVFPLLNCSKAYVKFNYITDKNYTESLFFYFYEGVIQGCIPSFPLKVPGEPVKYSFPFEKTKENTYILKKKQCQKRRI